MKEKYLTYLNGYSLPSPTFDVDDDVDVTKHFLKILEKSMKNTPLMKESQVTIEPKTNKYKYLLIGC